MPYHGSRYTAQTHHMYWDGGRHYWTGMAVKGMENQNPDNPLCCPDLALYEGEEVAAGPGTLMGLRAAMKRAGLSHRAATERLCVGVTSVRQRLYGRRPFARSEFNRLCRLAEIDPDRLLEGGRGEAGG